MSTTEIAKLRSVPRSAPVEEILSVFREDGGVIIKELLNPEQVDRFNRELRSPEVGYDGERTRVRPRFVVAILSLR